VLGVQPRPVGGPLGVDPDPLWNSAKPLHTPVAMATSFIDSFKLVRASVRDESGSTMIEVFVGDAHRFIDGLAQIVFLLQALDFRFGCGVCFAVRGYGNHPRRTAA
jgi:hypothetical protein